MAARLRSDGPVMRAKSHWNLAKGRNSRRRTWPDRPLLFCAWGLSVNEQLETLACIEERIRRRLTGLVRDFQLVLLEHELVLRGQAPTHYAKQLAQHAVLEATSLPIRANEIVVLGTRKPSTYMAMHPGDPPGSRG